MTLLSVTGLGKHFGGLRALSDVSLSVAAGRITGVIGPNGAGKTTLFACISGLHHPDAGSIHFNGQRIDGLPPHRVCGLGVARTFQLVRPFEGLSVLDNVTVGALLRHRRADAARASAHAVLEQLGLTHLADRAADGLGVADLRAMEVARALATEPRLLLLDEMLAGLTAVEAGAMHERFVQLRERGLGLLLIEHSVPTVTALCDQVTVLDFGRVIAQGSPAEVLADAQVQQAYLGKAHD
jgi:branched-chain amino acid transport system ATP-binding protein